MILRRLYLYLVSAAALATLATGLSLLGITVLLFIFNDPTAQDSRGLLAGFSAMTLVALPVWAVHFGFARRFALRDPVERASTIRRLYVYWACLWTTIAATIALSFTAGHLLRPILDKCQIGRSTCAPNPEWLVIAQGAWVLFVLLAIWAFHLRIATRDHAAVGERGGSATLRRWYMYTALLIGLLTMLAATQGVIQYAWLKAVDTSLVSDRYLGDIGGQLLAGLALWGVHSRLVSTRYLEDDRKSTLRALEGFIAVAVSIITALFGATEILYYAVARVIGINNPGFLGSDLRSALAPATAGLVVYGIAWFLIRRRLSRDTGSHEADRQAGIRRLYTNLAALVSMAALALGAVIVLWVLAEQVEAPLIGVPAGDWKDPISGGATLFFVGVVVWVAHWRHAPWAGDRQSTSRLLYVWAILLVGVLAVLGSGIFLLNVVLQQLFSTSPRLNSPDNLNFGHALAVLVVAVVLAIYHFRVLRADAASRPSRHEPASLPEGGEVTRSAGGVAPAAPATPVGASLPEGGASLPERGASLPERGASLPERGEVAPSAGGVARSAGGVAPSAGGVARSAGGVSTVTPAPVVTEHAKRYILAVVDASEDDVHQALTNLPPQASYRLTPEPD